MADSRLIYYAASSDAEHARRMREVVRESRKLLEQSCPDTFLGQRTQQFLPDEDEQ